GHSTTTRQIYLSCLHQLQPPSSVREMARALALSRSHQQGRARKRFPTFSRTLPGRHRPPLRNRISTLVHAGLPKRRRASFSRLSRVRKSFGSARAVISTVRERRREPPRAREIPKQ